MLTFYNIKGQAYPCYTYIGDFSCFSTVWVCTNEFKLKSQSLTYLVAFFREGIFFSLIILIFTWSLVRWLSFSLSKGQSKVCYTVYEDGAESDN